MFRFALIFVLVGAGIWIVFELIRIESKRRTRTSSRCNGVSTRGSEAKMKASRPVAVDYRLVRGVL